MKNILTVLTIGALVASSNLNAEEQIFDIPGYEVPSITEMPQPTRLTTPQVDRSLIGTTIELTFTVTKEGAIEGLKLAKPLHAYSDVEVQTYATRLLMAAKSWKFDPARYHDGSAAEVKVILPVSIITKDNRPTTIASIQLDSSENTRS